MADGDPPSSAPPPPFLADGLKPSLSSLLPSNPLFSEIVKGHSSQGYLSGILPKVDDPSLYNLKPISIYQNKPAVLFSSSDKKTLLDNVKHVLVGKFTHGRPSFSSIKEFFASLKLIGEYNLSILDAKHIFIECQSKTDFTRLWMRLTWRIKGYTMRMFKWDSDFTPIKESQIAPVWVRIEGLPLYLFEENSLLSIANSIGYPLRVDPRNIYRFNLSSARICVELDVSKPLLDDVWVCFIDELSQVVRDAFVVKVFFDFVPSYCKLCAHIGHHEGECKRSSVKINAVAKRFDVRPQTEKSGVCKVFDILSQTEKPGANKVFDVCPQTEKPGVVKVFDVLSQPSQASPAGHHGSRHGGKDMVSVRRVCSVKAVPENAPHDDQAINQNSVQPLSERGPTVASSAQVQGSTLEQISGPDVQQIARSSEEQCKVPETDKIDTSKTVMRLLDQENKTVTEQNETGSTISGGIVATGDLVQCSAARELQQGSALSVTTQQNTVMDEGDIVQCSVAGDLQLGSSLTVPLQQTSNVEQAKEDHDIQEHKFMQDKTPTKVFDKLPQPSIVSAVRLGSDSARHCGSHSSLEVGHAPDSERQDAVLLGEPHGGLFHTPTLKRVEAPCLLNKSASFGITQGKYNGSDLIGCKQKVGSFIKDLEDLWATIEKADSTTIARIRDSPATKVFLQSRFEHCRFDPFPMNDLMETETAQDPTELPSGTQDSGTQQKQGHIALIQHQDKDRVPEMRGQGLPFDDKG